MAAYNKERKNEMKTNTKKTDIPNRIGQMMRGNKLVVGVVVFLAVVASIGIGMEQLDNAKRKRDVAAIKTAMTLPESTMREQAMNGNPYAMYAWGKRLHEKATERCEGVGEYGRALGLYTDTAPSVIDYALLNEAGKYLLGAAESAARIDNREFLYKTRSALWSWQSSARSVKAPILKDRVFMQRINQFWDKRGDVRSTDIQNRNGFKAQGRLAS